MNRCISSLASLKIAFTSTACAALVLIGGAAPAVADPATRALMDMAARVAARDVSVLIGGPTGTGSDITDGTVHWKYLAAFVFKPFGAIDASEEE